MSKRIFDYFLINPWMYFLHYTLHTQLYKSQKYAESQQLMYWPSSDCLIHWLITYIYRVSQEECEILRESVPYVKLYRYNPKHLYPKLNGYGINGHRKVCASVVSTNCTPSVTQYSSTAQAQQGNCFMEWPWRKVYIPGSSDVTR